MNSKCVPIHAAMLTIENYGPCPICGESQRFVAAERIALLEKVAEAAEKLKKFRDIPCSGETACDTDDCGVVSHNHIICKTKEARDALDDMYTALRAAGYLEEGE